MPRKNTKKSSTTAIEVSCTIVLLLYLISGALLLTVKCAQISNTGLQLLVLRDNAICYNENSRKTDSMTEDYQTNHAKRQNIYHSDDVIIRVFSNLPTIIKGIVWIFAIISTIVVPILTIVGSYIIIKWVVKKTIKQSKRKNNRKRLDKELQK